MSYFRFSSCCLVLGDILSSLFTSQRLQSFNMAFIPSTANASSFWSISVSSPPDLTRAAPVHGPVFSSFSGQHADQLASKRGWQLLCDGPSWSPDSPRDTSQASLTPYLLRADQCLVKLECTRAFFDKKNIDS
jgi:hypothetical protein